MGGAKKIKPALLVGSGLEGFSFFDHYEEVSLETPYGMPSSTLIMENFRGMEVVILSRHGREHSIPPTQVNSRANIWALKEAGCTHILAVSACGSLREHIEMGDIIFPDQFIDFTRHRPITFFEHYEDHKPMHATMPEPFDEGLKQLYASSAKHNNIKHHNKATLITIEGPRLSTRAESHMFRSWGADIINMSTAPEVILANELKIPFALAALSTDYDAWRDNSEAVSWEGILEVFHKNIKKIRQLLLGTLEMLSEGNSKKA